MLVRIGIAANIQGVFTKYAKKVGERRENPTLRENKRRAQKIQTLTDARRREGGKSSTQASSAGIRESEWSKTEERISDPTGSFANLCATTRVEGGKNLHRYCFRDERQEKRITRDAESSSNNPTFCSHLYL